MINLKFAYCMNVFDLENQYTAAKRIKDIGYDGIELWEQFIENTETNKLGEFLEEEKITLEQICPYFSLTAGKDELINSIKKAEKYLRYCEILNCKKIRVFTGDVASAEVDASKYKQAIGALQEMCSLSEDVLFVLETHDGSLMDKGPATKRLLQEVSHKNLKVNLQVPLNYGKEDVFESAEMLGENVVHVHAHNWIGSFENLTYLNSGDYNFKKFIKTLKNKGFDGCISIEHGHHHHTKDPFEVALHEIEYLKKNFL